MVNNQAPETRYEAIVSENSCEMLISTSEGQLVGESEARGINAVMGK